MTETTRRGLNNVEWVEVWEQMTPMRRFAEPSEIANVMLFLGGIAPVDGGYTYWQPGVLHA